MSHIVQRRPTDIAFNPDGTVRDHDPRDPNCPSAAYLQALRKVVASATPEEMPGVRNRFGAGPNPNPYGAPPLTAREHNALIAAREKLRIEDAARHDRELTQAAHIAEIARAANAVAFTAFIKRSLLIVGVAWLLFRLL